MNSILVICTGNSCRSQIAEGYLKKFIEELNLNIKVFSAGLKAEGVNKRAIKIMCEDDIDISSQTSNTITKYNNMGITHVITVCNHANENCPIFLNKSHKVHHNFNDPSKVIGNNEEIKKAFKKTRDEIKLFCENYLNQYFSHELS